MVGHIGLYGEYVGGRPVPAVRPQAGSGRAIVELRIDPDLLAFALDRAFENIADVQILGDLARVCAGVSVRLAELAMTSISPKREKSVTISAVMP
jgi:hypothetical protein